MRICYFNITKNIPTRDSVYLQGLKECGVEIIDIRDSSAGFKKFVNIYKRHKELKGVYDILWVGYSAYILVPFARMISRKPVVFDGLLALYDGIIVSRKQANVFSLKSLYCWLLDFLAFHLATVSLIENNIQIEYISRKYFLSKKKLFMSWTGVDENDFFYDPTIPKLSDFTVIFRGGLLPDSGIEYFVEAAKILKDMDIKFRLIGDGLSAPKVEEILKTFDNKNFLWIRERVAIEDLRKKMQESQLQVGWLTDEPRSWRSIEHKTFESLALRLPFLHGRTPGVEELLKEGKTGFFCNNNDAKDLANKILGLKNNPSLLSHVAEAGYRFFDEELRSKYLAKKVLDYLRTYHL